MAKVVVCILATDRYRFGNETDKRAKVSKFDPRALADRAVNHEALSQRSAELSNCF